VGRFGYDKIAVVEWELNFNVTRYMHLWLFEALLRFFMAWVSRPDLTAGADKRSAIAHFADSFIGPQVIFHIQTAKPVQRCCSVTDLLLIPR